MIVYLDKIADNSSFGLLQKAFRLKYGNEITQRELMRDQDGKPRFKEVGRPFFNISHSGEYVACVFFESEIGLDIQQIKIVPEKLVNRYLDVACKDAVAQTIEWTKFESFGKMKGTGIPPLDDYRQGTFLISRDLSGYIIAVCTERECNQAIELVFL